MSFRDISDATTNLSRTQANAIEAKLRQAFEQFVRNKHRVEEQIDGQEARLRQQEATNNRLKEQVIEATRLGGSMPGSTARQAGLRRQQSREDLKTMDSRQDLEIEQLRKALEEAEETIKLQGEQLDNKRDIWFKMNRDEWSKSRSASTSRNPFDSPGDTARNKFSARLAAQQAVSTPSASKRVSIKSPQQSQGSSPDVGGVSLNAALASRRVQALKGQTDVSAGDTSQALVLHSLRRPSLSNAEAANELAAQGEVLREMFGHLFAMHEGWVRKYASQPNVSDDDIHRRNPKLWGYMQDLTFSGRRSDAHNHVLLLIRNGKTRLWFVMRMALTYSCKDIMVLKAWKGFTQASDDDIDEIQNTFSGDRGQSPLCRFQIQAF